MTEEQLTLTEQVKKEKVKFIESGKSKKKHFMAVKVMYTTWRNSVVGRSLSIARHTHFWRRR